MMSPPPPDFHDLQRLQKIRSLAVFGLLLVFYVAATGLMVLAGVLTVGIFTGRLPFSRPGFWSGFLPAVILFAGAVAALHYLDARKNGAAFLLKRLRAEPADPADRYHRIFLNAVEGVRIAAGLPSVEAMVLPTFSMNSLALVQAGGRPAVVVTEGLLADCSSDEIEAVAAHEIAHIARGDTVLLTLVCGLSSFFERLKAALEPDIEPAGGGRPRRGDLGGSAGFLFLAAALGSVVIRLLGVFVSREREHLADATAVEFGRSPEALARVIVKARTRNTFIGDMSEAYGPLFLIAPDAPGESGRRAPHWTSSHPPFRTRLERLAAMVRKTPEDILSDVAAARKARLDSRTVYRAFGEGASTLPEKSPLSSADAPVEADGEWAMLGPDGKASGPWTLGELIFTPGFSPLVPVRNTTEGLEGRAGDFPQVRDALKRARQGKPVDPGRTGVCPRCRIPLGDAFYEGVAIRTCRSCRGKLVLRKDMDRILARREAGFSDDLLRKAEAFEAEHLLNPRARPNPAGDRSPSPSCPSCGYRMMPRPYNYQYFVPVDKCLSCGRIWFDADELEILQILVEKARGEPSP